VQLFFKGSYLPEHLEVENQVESQLTPVYIEIMFGLEYFSSMKVSGVIIIINRFV